MTAAAFAEVPRLDRTSWGLVGLWTFAAIVTLSAHIVAVAWAMRETPIAPADDSPPAAIMIELAPETVAPEIDEQNIAVDQQVAQQVEAEPVEETEPAEEVVETEPVTQPDPEVLPEPAPERIVEEETEVAEAEPVEAEPVEEEEPLEEVDPIEEEVTAQLENVEVPLPTWRPKPPEKEVVKKEQPKAKKAVRKPPAKKPTPSRNADVAKVQTKQSKVAAASQTSAGAGSNVSPARWQSRLLAHLERRKRYPSASKSRGEQGTAYVRFRIDDAGNVMSVSLARSSGFPALDEEVVAMVRRASPVPAPPQGVNKNITVPVRFSVR